MFPPEFDYRRAASLDEALALLSDGDRDVRPIAGGQGLVQDLKLGAAGPDLLVDVSDVDALAGVDARDGDGEDHDGDGGRIEIGALTTHAELASSAAVEERAPVLADAARQLADRQVRNRGTVGGNLAEADPAADLPAAVVAAGATLHLRGTGSDRSVPAGEFFEGDGETALRDGELLTAVEVPAHPAGAYVRKTHPASGYALVGVAAVADETVTDLRVAANGVQDHAIRLRAVEEALQGQPVDADLASAAERAREALDPDRQRGDAHASAEFRAELLVPYTERAVATALDRATSGGGTA